MSHRSYLTMSQPRKTIGPLVPDLFLSLSTAYTSLKYKDILAVRMDRIEDEVRIVDAIELPEGTSSPETIQRFLFGSTLDVRIDGHGKLILTSDEFSCTLFQLLDCDGDLYRGEGAGTFRGWCSYTFKEILPTYGVDFRLISEMSHPSIKELAKWASPLQSSTAVQFSTIIKLAKCASLSECSTAVRNFAGLVDLPK